MILEISEQERIALLEAVNYCCIPEKQQLGRIKNLLNSHG